MKADWDTNEWRIERDRKMMEWLGDHDAVNCVLTISSIAELWDDIVDKENVTEERVHQAFILALVGLNENPFWRANSHRLLPILVVFINAWLDANIMQKSEKRSDRMWAFYLRNLGLELAQAAAYILGGWRLMREISPEVRKFFEHETFDEWEHAHDGK